MLVRGPLIVAHEQVLIVALQANASGTAQDQRGGRGAVLAGRHALRRSAPQDGVAEPGFPPLGTGVRDRKRVLRARWPFRTPSRSQGPHSTVGATPTRSTNIPTA